jgi:predicted transcriptional regulator|tara:strand:+ start:493 stop:690 length:198 start_codon:yes stop_codon:yes gene_type:complete
MDIFQEIKNAFQTKQETLKNLLADGQVEDYNQYKQIVGTLSGIEWAYTELTRIVNNRMENDLDDD